MDREWAKARNWPKSMYLPDDKSKGVYLLEGYHQLHCLKILRTTMGESLMGEEFTYAPGEHIEHCFDYLLQVGYVLVRVYARRSEGILCMKLNISNISFADDYV